jgi:hypothetical protein
MPSWLQKFLDSLGGLDKLLWLPALGAIIVAIVGAVWALYQYVVTRRVEARQPFLSQQLTLYFKAAEVTGKFTVLTPNTDEWTKNEAVFWELYWSELSVVETEEVEEAMVKVGKALDAYKKSANVAKKDELNDAIYNLAHAIRDSIRRGWRASLLF